MLLIAIICFFIILILAVLFRGKYLRGNYLRRFMARKDCDIRRIFREEARRQREFDKFMNRQVHQAFNLISKKN